ncbi:MAG: DUF6261 family protein [Prevotellaceae bacterium]|jgi:hypothetical protein|nr:DUF6261 family protein [Prevotellaceae bacterium]
MNAKIDGYKTMLTYISVAQSIQFHKNVLEQIAPFVRRIDVLISIFINYKSDYARLDAEFNKKNKSIETVELETKDDKRDSTTGQLIFRIDYHLRFPINKDEMEAARILNVIVEKYSGAPRREYEIETSLLRNMIAELRSYSKYLILFGLTSLVNRLDKENNDFEAIYITRTNFIKAKGEHETLPELVAKVNNSFEIQCRSANGLSMTPLTTDAKAAVDEIISIINAQIQQHTAIYNCHIDAITSRNNNETMETQQE